MERRDLPLDILDRQERVGVAIDPVDPHLVFACHLPVMEKQGRCHYYRLRSAEVARAIEGLMTVATIPSNAWPPDHHVEPALREARICYDHMAGRLGVAVCDMVLRRHHVVLVDGGGEMRGSTRRPPCTGSPSVMLIEHLERQRLVVRY